MKTHQNIRPQQKLWLCAYQIQGVPQHIPSFPYTEIKNHFDLIKGGKIQGSNKFITDQTENIISIKKNKLDVIMSMVSIEKILADYDFKDRKEDDEDGNDSKYTKLLELMNK